MFQLVLWVILLTHFVKIWIKAFWIYLVYVLAFLLMWTNQFQTSHLCLESCFYLFWFVILNEEKTFNNTSLPELNHIRHHHIISTLNALPDSRTPRYILTSLMSHLDLVSHDLTDLSPQDLLLLLGPDSSKLPWCRRGQRSRTTLVQAVKLPHFILHGLLGLGVTFTDVPERMRDRGRDK